MCHRWYGTLKNSLCSLALSTEYRSKFEAFHRYCWCFHMSEILSGLKKNPKQTNTFLNVLSHHFSRFFIPWLCVRSSCWIVVFVLLVIPRFIDIFSVIFLSRVFLDIHDVSFLNHFFSNYFIDTFWSLQCIFDFYLIPKSIDLLILCVYFSILSGNVMHIFSLL